MINLFLIIVSIGVISVASCFKKGTAVKLTAIIIAVFVFSYLISMLTGFDTCTNQFQFVQEGDSSEQYDLFLGIDGLSLYFVLLTGFIIPGALLSNVISINNNIIYLFLSILVIECLLLLVFMALDILLFYIFFESVLPPLFLLIGLFGAANKIKAGYYLFLYTLLGSIFLLLAILAISSVMHTTDYDSLFKKNLVYITQEFIFYGAFFAIAVKTPVIFLNIWLLKAHVESPLAASIILAAVVLKLSLYGILRLILPLLTKAYTQYTNMIFAIGVATIWYASISTIRTIDVKELIAYSSVSHAAVYLLGAFSNCLQGIEGAICLGLGHGLVSPGLFICAGGVLYDRVHTRVMPFFRGLTQTMPLFAILFFILCLANCGAPLSFNFIGEFLSLYGVFERSFFLGILASSSIVFSAAYTIFMYQRISLGGSLSRMVTVNLPDLNKREFMLLLTLVIPAVILGIYPAPILDGIHYSVSTLLYSFDNNVISCDAPNGWGLYFSDTTSNNITSNYTWFTIVFVILSFILGFKYYNRIKNDFLTISIYLSQNRREAYSLYLLATLLSQVLWFIYISGDTSLLGIIFMCNYAEFADFISNSDMAYLGSSEDGCREHPNDYDGTVHRSNPEGETGANGATTNGATTNGATTNGATTNGATTNGATTNGATANGQGNNSGDNGLGPLSICPDRNGQGHVWSGDSAQISSDFRCHYNSTHPAGRNSSYYFCLECGAYSCTSCI